MDVVRVLVAGAVVLLLAGCAPEASPTPRPVSTPSASRTAVVVPGRLPGEIARGTVSPSAVGQGAGAMPSAGSVYLRAACSGPAGSTMHVALRSGAGVRFGPEEDLDCDGTVSVVGTSAANRPSRVQVAVEGDRGVTGYAVLSTSAEG